MKNMHRQLAAVAWKKEGLEPPLSISLPAITFMHAGAPCLWEHLLHTGCCLEAMWGGLGCRLPHCWSLEEGMVFHREQGKRKQKSSSVKKQQHVISHPSLSHRAWHGTQAGDFLDSNMAETFLHLPLPPQTLLWEPSYPNARQKEHTQNTHTCRGQAAAMVVPSFSTHAWVGLFALVAGQTGRPPQLPPPVPARCSCLVPGAPTVISQTVTFSFQHF